MHAIDFSLLPISPPPDKMLAAAEEIESELAQQLGRFEREKNCWRHSELARGPRFDLEMTRKLAIAKEFEIYSRYITEKSR
jgi:excinuclease UvrABC helicase subunit UvrB